MALLYYCTVLSGTFSKTSRIVCIPHHGSDIMRKPSTAYRKKVVGTRVMKVHRLIAEKILGRPLKGKECIHHVNGNGLDNRHENLVICPDQDFHMLLHKRQRALDACGNPDFRKCINCGEWADPTTMRRAIKGRMFAHRWACNVRVKQRHMYRMANDAAYREQYRKEGRLRMRRRRKELRADPTAFKKYLEQDKLRARKYRRVHKEKVNARDRQRYAEGKKFNSRRARLRAEARA
jgi:hypothetical protein